MYFVSPTILVRIVCEFFFLGFVLILEVSPIIISPRIHSESFPEIFSGTFQKGFFPEFLQLFLPRFLCYFRNFFNESFTSYSRDCIIDFSKILPGSFHCSRDFFIAFARFPLEIPPEIYSEIVSRILTVIPSNILLDISPDIYVEISPSFFLIDSSRICFSHFSEVFQVILLRRLDDFSRILFVFFSWFFF